jgi:D-inositol-3-phosphate glycosyltransferase
MNVYVLALAQELAARRFCVDIFTRYHTPRDPEVVRVGPQVRVIHVPTANLEETKEGLHLSVPQYVEGIEAFRVREGLDYGLVHSHYWLSGQAGIDLSRQWRVPHLTSFHTLAEVKNEAFTDNTEAAQRAPTEARVAAKADWTIAWTQHEADSLVRLYGASPSRIAVVPIGVDTSLFQPQDRVEARRRLGIPLDGEVVLFVGRFDPIKGVRLLPEIASCLRDRPQLRLLAVGGDQMPGETGRLLQHAHDLGVEDKLCVLPPAPHEELPWYYSAADVQIVPSYYESFSMVTAEALACGTPVVASNVGGPASLVKDGLSGFLTPPGDAEALATKVRGLLDNEDMRRDMAAHARETVTHLAWPAVTDRITQLYAASLDNAASLTACMD